ncbi:hypothetical protein AVEN_48121-1 [Araneus ventricosus]|uniref:HTH CENPB-type domain-containing protein n=1 Tax=Araneus ventricosus TaxID=182803 RepID=A0A4Y2L5Z2_ARAVE|nr:hypothetical protein AVEN_48121-1 [Araneus ventricosus]
MPSKRGKSVRASAEEYKTDKKKTLTSEEYALEKYLQLASKLYYGLSPKTTREFAYPYAIANGKCILENWSTNKSSSWLKGFMYKYKDSFLRYPESTTGSILQKKNLYLKICSALMSRV